MLKIISKVWWKEVNTSTSAVTETSDRRGSNWVWDTDMQPLCDTWCVLGHRYFLAQFISDDKWVLEFFFSINHHHTPCISYKPTLHRTYVFFSFLTLFKWSFSLTAGLTDFTFRFSNALNQDPAPTLRYTLLGLLVLKHCACTQILGSSFTSLHMWNACSRIFFFWAWILCARWSDEKLVLFLINTGRKETVLVSIVASNRVWETTFYMHRT